MLNIQWQPDRSEKLQLHVQIVRFIKDKISSGEWPVGFKIPSQRALSALFNVNRSTVVTAIEELTAEGLLKGNTGGGTTVISNTWTLMSSQNSTDWNHYISSGAHQSNHLIMQQINQAEFEPGIIRMGSCEPSPDLMPNEMIQSVFKKLSDSKVRLGYEEPQGSIYLRTEISMYLKNTGIAAGPENILITSGAIQALQLIAIGLLNKNAVVYLEKPSYLYSLRIFQSFGLQLSGVPVKQEGLDLKDLLARNAQKKGSMLFSIPTFQNPTGNVMPLEQRKKLMTLCQEQQLPIIEDDVYNELWLDEPPPPPLKALDDSGLVLYVGGMSKNLGPGLRIGWVVGSEQVIRRLSDIKMQTDYGTSSLSQNVATELFISGMYQEHNVILRNSVRIRRDTALAALDKYFIDHATWQRPSGGYFIWVKLNRGISMQSLFVKALKRKVLIHPGDLYEFHSNQHIRISYSYASLDEIELGIKVLAELIVE